MERKLITIAAALTAVVLLATLWGVCMNPMNTRRAKLAERLEAIQPVDVAFERPTLDFAGWKQSITAKDAVWNELVPPPLAPAPAPAPPPSAPDIKSKLKDVQATRSQVGKKVRFIWPESPDGEFKTVGDKICGCTIKEITRTDVTFTLSGEGGESTYKMSRD